MSDAIKTYNNMINNGSEDTKTFVEQIDQSNPKLAAAMKQYDSGSMSVADYAKSLVTARAKAIAFGAATTIMNAAISTGVSLLVNAAVSKFVEWSQASERAEESAHNFYQSMSEFQSEFAEGSKKISELSSRYDTLSKGVNSAGQNVSLTSEQYSEYKEIVSQLSELMPNLSATFNDQGEKIGFVQGKLKDASKEYKEYIKNQANSYLLNGDEDGNTFQSVLDTYQEKTQKTDNSLTQFGHGFLDALALTVSLGTHNAADFGLDKTTQYTTQGQIEKLEELGKKTNGLTQDGFLGFGLNFSKTDIDIYEKLLNQDFDEILDMDDQKFESFRQKYLSKLESLKTGQETIFSQMKTGFQQMVLGSDDYWNIDNESVKENITTFVSSISSSLFNSLDIDPTNQNDIQTFINKIINLFAENKDGFADAYKNLLSVDVDNLPVDEARSQIQNYSSLIAKSMGLDPKNGGIDIIQTMAGYGNWYNDVATKYDHLVSYATDGTYGSVKDVADSKGYNQDDVLAVLSDNSINTEEEIDAFQKILETTNSLDTATERYQLKLERSAKTASSFKDVFNSSEFADSKETLIQLAKSGELSPETLNSTEEYKNLLKETGLSAEDAFGQITNLLTSTEKLSALRQGLTNINSAYEEFQNKKFVSAETLDTLPDSFKNLKGFDLFSQVVGNPESGEKKVKKAFNNIISEYIKNNKTLEGITEKNKDAVIANLADAGITNADEVIDNYLSQNAQIEKTANSLFENLSQLNETDYQNFITTLTEKGKVSAEAANVIGANNASMINNLSSEYQTDLVNWLELCRQKKEAYNKLASAVGGSNKKEAKKNFKKIVTKDESELTAKDMGAYEYATKAGATYNPKTGKTSLKAEKEEQKAKKKFKLDQIDTDFDLNYSPKTAGTSSTAGASSQSKETINWMTRKLDVLQSKIDLTKTKFENLFSLKAKTGNLNAQISQTTKLLNAESKAAGKYQKKADHIKLSKNAKTDQSLKNKAKNGKITGSLSDLIADYGENTAKKISNFQDYTDKAKEARKATEELHKSIKDLTKQKLQLQLDTNEKKRSYSEAKYANSTSVSQKNKILKEEIDTYMTDDKAYQTYYNNAVEIRKSTGKTAISSINKSKLSKSLKSKIKNLIKKGKEIPDDLLKKVKNANISLYNQLINYNNDVDYVSETLLDKKLAKEENKTNIREKQIEQHQNLADEYQSILDRYSAEKALGKTADEKNSYIDSEKAATEALYNEKIAIAALEGKNNEEAQLRAELSKQLLDLEIEQHQNLADEHQANLDMLSAQKENLKTAGEKNGVIDQEKTATQALYTEKIAIAHLEGNTSEEQQLQAELTRQMVVLEKEKLDNIAAYYSNLRKITELQNKNLGNAVEELEARGLIVTSKLYSSQITLNNELKRNREEELMLLEEQHDKIEKGTQEWYDSLDAIQACKDNISELTKNTIELEKASRNVGWQLFEKLSSRLDLVSSEYDLAIKLMSNKKLADDDTGNFTEEGTATLGAYYSQLVLTQEKANGLLSILKTMKSHIDNGDDGFTDPAVLDEYNEKCQQYIDLINSEYDIQQNLIDMMKEKYQAELDYLQDIINKRKELLQAEKDAYDYQRSIEEKTKNISSIQKQMVSLNGDDSESAKTRLQQLQVKLDEANQDLADTEYQQWISDQQKMLDNLYNEYEAFIDDKLNDVDALLQEAVTYLSQVDIGTSVSTTLDEYYTKYGYAPTEDLKNINAALGTEGSIVTAIGNAATTIASYLQQQQRYQEMADDVETDISKIGNVYEDVNAIKRYEEAQKSFDQLATAGDNGENIQNHVSSSSVSTLDTTGKEVQKIYASVQDAINALNSVNLETESDYNETNLQLLERANQLYNNLSTSGKQLFGDNLKYILGYKNLQANHWNGVMQQKAADAANQAAQEAEKDKQDKRDSIKRWVAGQKSNKAWWIKQKYNDSTETQKLIHDKIFDPGSGARYLNNAGLNALGSYLDTLGIPGGYLIDRLRGIGFSHGGIADTLQKIPAINGDDGWITVKRGEAVLTPEQTKAFHTLTDNLDILNPAVDLLAAVSKPPAASFPKNGHSSTQIGEVDFHFELPNVVDSDSFIQEMQTNPKVEKVIKTMLWDKNSLSKHRI